MQSVAAPFRMQSTIYQTDFPFTCLVCACSYLQEFYNMIKKKKILFLVMVGTETQLDAVLPGSVTSGQRDFLASLQERMNQFKLVI